MATLEGQQIKNSYKDLLQVSNSNAGVDGTLRTVEDGEGTTSALQLSSSAAKVAGNLTVTGNVVFNDGTTLSTAPAGGTDQSVKVSSNDTTAGFLNGKLVAGSSISLTEGTDGGDETLTIAYTGSASGINNVVEDTSPQLGGSLDCQQHYIITAASNRNVEVAAHGTGQFVVRGNTNPGAIALNCENNSHAVVVKSPTHASGGNYSLTLPTSLSAGALFTSSGGQLSTGDLPVADGGTGASDQAGARQNLGLQIGSDVQAYDAGLNSIAGLTTAADKMIYTTGSDTYAVTTITAAGRAILDDADASAQKATLGLEIGTDILAYDAGLNSIAGLTTAANKMIYTTGSDTYAVADLSAQARSLLDDADAAAMRSTLGIGTAATSASSDFLASASPSVSSGTLTLTSSGLTFSDGTTQTTAASASAGISTGKAIAMAMIFG